MAFPQYDAPHLSPPVAEEWRLAAVFDRLLAFFLDFLIFSPIIALATSFALKDFRLLLLVDPESPELSLVWFSFLGGVFGMSVLMDALCTLYWGATPGQKFLHLQVRSYPGTEPLTLLQCLSRSLLWFLSIPLMLPLLGIYTNRMRRALHDRATDTIVVTLKAEGDPGPVDAERGFFLSWSRVMILALCLGAFGVFAEFGRGLSTGDFKRHNAVATGLLCEGLDPDMDAEKRLDQAVARYLAETISRDCLEREADFALWQENDKNEALSHLAKGLALEDEEESKDYLGKVCDLQKDGESCAIVHYLAADDEESAAALRKSGQSLVTSRVLLAKGALESSQLTTAIALLRDLRTTPGMETWLDKQEIRAFWKMRGMNNNRQPASSEAQDLMKEFEKRYELE